MQNSYLFLTDNNLAFASIFFCISVCFLLLKLAVRPSAGPGFLAVSYLSNGVGFLFWSGEMSLTLAGRIMVGDAFHLIGFLFLFFGVYRFCGYGWRKWNAVAVLLCFAAWFISFGLAPGNLFLAMLLLKSLRALIFIGAGLLILKKRPAVKGIGKYFASHSLFLWGLYIVLSAFIDWGAFKGAGYGLLVGLQIIATFGMLILLLQDAVRQSESAKLRIKELEGLLPICSYCKKIRDKKNEWHVLELYIEDHSRAEFSHGICPECMEKHRPDRD